MQAGKAGSASCGSTASTGTASTGDSSSTASTGGSSSIASYVLFRDFLSLVISTMRGSVLRTLAGANQFQPRGDNECVWSLCLPLNTNFGMFPGLDADSVCEMNSSSHAAALFRFHGLSPTTNAVFLYSLHKSSLMVWHTEALKLSGPRQVQADAGRTSNGGCERALSDPHCLTKRMASNGEGSTSFQDPLSTSKKHMYPKNNAPKL